ncbi:unnamed protein product [Effrenium voratum]|uniref:Uncharacterized protein n=1 Tax=Effrenium voratum TaxID=2562239 RepID=A0AA36HL84_9DINO|nr:unnamed protein product [Effrenium voratum]CAJ1425929.1 unnamed protein product [Effrenium voratum]
MSASQPTYNSLESCAGTSSSWRCRESGEESAAEGCEHGLKWKSSSRCGKCKGICKVCNGVHGTAKQNCVQCNQCPHGHRRGMCKLCNGKDRCAICRPCAHGKLKAGCKKCSGRKHGKLRQKCKVCKAAQKRQDRRESKGEPEEAQLVPPNRGRDQEK